MSQIDERNLGGRVQISNLMNQHQKALLNIKPTLNTKIKPKEQSKKQRPASYKKQEEFNEVFTSFKKIANAKSNEISRAPKTFHKNKQKKQKISQSYSDKYLNWNHHLNLLSSNKKILSIGNQMNERKKNQFDPIAHPVRFLREKESGNSNICIDSLFSQICKEKEKLVPFQQNSKMKHKIPQNSPYDIYGQTAKQLAIQRVKLKNQQMNRLTETGMIANENQEINEKNQNTVLIPIPQTHDKTAEDYQYIKKKLIQTIIEYRIYKAEDLQSLFGRTLLYNKHMDVSQLEDIFAYIQAELDS